jgi:hypothetical protein
MGFAGNVTVCLACRHKQRGGGQDPICLDDPAKRPYRICARLHECPHELFPSRGLGDTLAKITHMTGMDKVVKAVAGDDCGCGGRQQSLNKAVPYDAAGGEPQP